MKWHTDGAFPVHPDMHSHTGGSLTLRKGSMYGVSTRQKLNTQSSMEVDATDGVYLSMWCTKTKRVILVRNEETTSMVVGDKNKTHFTVRGVIMGDTKVTPNCFKDGLTGFTSAYSHTHTHLRKSYGITSSP